MTAAAPTYLLRAATPDDAPAVHSLEAESFGVDAWSPAVVADALARPDRWVVVAEPAGGSCAEVAGYAVLLVTGGVADLERIAVHPAYRRTGLGAALLGAVRSAAGEAAAERLLLEVGEGNVAARGLYAAHGAVELHRRRRYYRDGSDALVLQLPTGAEETDRG